MPKPTLPPIYKTKQMFDIEAANGGRDIRLILVDLYNELGSQAAVAKALKVTQPTIDDWASRLGITFTVKRIAEIGEPQPA